MKPGGRSQKWLLSPTFFVTQNRYSFSYFECTFDSSLISSHCSIIVMDEDDGFDEEIQRLLKGFLSSGINFFRSSSRNNRELRRMMDIDDVGTIGFGMFSDDEMKEWRKDNR